MSEPGIGLDPTTHAKLRAFAARRRRLIWMRGLAAAVVCLLGAMTVAAVPDYLLLLSDPIRLALSVAAYGAAAITLWLVCLRAAWRWPDEKEIALRIESAEPGLRERLIAAVELGVPQPDDRLDSAQFRGMVQRDVARRMEATDIRSLLPWKLAAGWISALAAVLAISSILALIPGLGYTTWISRALLPLADIERLSSTRISILEPAPASLLSPEGDSVRILVELDGRLPDTATLQTTQPGQPRQTLAMTRQDDRHFAATLIVGREPVTYRVQAGDGLTRHRKLESRPRPYVTRFEKTYRYPEYSQLPSVHREDDKEGDLAALEGSEADLVLQADQPIAAGELRIEQGKQTMTIPLKIEAEQRLVAKVPIQAMGSYQVHLTAAGTRFVSKFMPRYEINAQPDLPPRVQLVAPTDNAVTQADDILAFRGGVEDDLALERVEQMIRVNRQEWITIPLPIQGGARAEIRRPWDLIDLKLRAGDKVVTKLAAVDRKGNRAESSPATLTITSNEYDPRRLSALKAKQRFTEVFRELAGKVSAARAALKESADPLAKLPIDHAQAKTYLSQMSLQARELSTAASQSLRQMPGPIRQVESGADAHDLALAGRLAASVEHEHAMAVRYYLSRAAEAGTVAQREAAVKAALKAMETADNEMRATITRTEDILEAELAGVTMEDVRTLAGGLAAIGVELNRPDRDQTTTRWVQRRLGVAAIQAKQLKETADQTARYLARSRNKSLFDAIFLLAREAAMVDKELSADKSEIRLDSLWMALRQAVDRVLPMVRHRASDSADTLVAARRSLNEKSDTVYELMHYLKSESEKTAKAAATLANPKKRPTDPAALDRLTSQLQESKRAAIELRWPQAAGMLRAMGQLEEARPDSDSRFAADLGMASRALKSLHERFTADAADDADSFARISTLLEQMSDSLRVLESVHGIGENATVLGQLIQREQYQRQSAPATTRHPRQWDLAEQQMGVISRELKRSKADRPAATHLGQIPGKSYARAADKEMDQRRREQRETSDVQEELAAVKRDVQMLLGQFDDAQRDARLKLQAIAPTVAQLMRDAAQKTEKLREKTAQAAHQPPQDPARPADRTQPPAADQQEVRQRLVDVMDALRQEANLQNLMKEEDREKAHDADAAAAMIRQQSQQAQTAMDRATTAQKPADQTRHLEEAARHQQALGQTLSQLAEHYQQMAENKKADATRQALRQAGQQMGLQRQLQQPYAQAKKLAELAALSPQELMKRLETELSGNRAMRRELDQISQAAAQQAGRQLAQAAAMEQANADRLQQADLQLQKMQQQNPGEQMRQLQQQIKELAGKKLPEAAASAESARAAAAKQKLNEAQQPADQAAAAMPAESPSTPQQSQPAAEQLKKQSEMLRQTAAAAKQAAQLAAAAMQQNQRMSSQAQQAAAMADQQARQAQRVDPDSPAAQNAADRAQRAEQMSKQAQEQTRQAAAAQKQSQEAAATAQTLADQANQIAANIETQPQQMASAQAAAQKQMKQAADQQKPIGQLARQSAADLERAARHEMRLGNAEGARMLEQRANQAATAAQNQVPAAAQALQQPNTPAQAQPAVRNAAAALAQAAQQASAMASTSQPGKPGQPDQSGQPSSSSPSPGSPPSGSPGSPSGSPTNSESPFSGATASQLAQALDQLDRTMNAPTSPGSPGTSGSPASAMQPGQLGAPGSQPATSPGQSAAALQSAGQALSRALSQARSQADMPSNSPTSTAQAADVPGGAAVIAGDPPYQQLPGAAQASNDDWGKLPPQLAKDLMEGRRESVSPEYKAMVETYFRVIAERARGDRKP